MNDAFIKQNTRKDVLINMLNNIKNPELYNILMSDNQNNDDSRKGYLYETISIILLISKCLSIDYDYILESQLQNLHTVININEILKSNIHNGNNVSDITIKYQNIIIPFSIKYRNKFIPKDSDISILDNTLKTITASYKLGLIVKNKNLIINHNYKNDATIHKELHNTIIENNLLLDENDIKEGLKIFCSKFSNLNIETFIELINSEYLLTGRKQLRLKLHQKMTYLKFIQDLPNSNKFLISHKPRSGKSITLLNIAKYLLENTETNKILIMTSVPATIKSFINDLDFFQEFINIKYINQEDLNKIDTLYKGIVFCSVQFLKTNTQEKQQYLININFDVIIIDECHLGSSTTKTENEILNIKDLQDNIKINIFASGTAEKTRKFYKIKHVYEWDIEDEAFMKELNNNYDDEIIEMMINRHGTYFLDCYNDITLNKDYRNHPTQVLIKHLVSDELIAKIKEYNIKNNTMYGYSCNSLFALNKIRINGEYEYETRFSLEMIGNDGIDILKIFFENIISNNKMNNNTIMRKVENIQKARNSRISTIKEPKLILVYLPVNTRNNNISQLQKTFKRFIKENDLWKDYNIEYSNSIQDSGDYKEEYNDYIETIINKTIKDNKKGCFLLLGNKGGVGITYHNCDVTISLDDGHNIDNQKQRYSRALTEAVNKTVGINIDMNIQRTYLYINELLHKHKKITRTMKTNGEILKYLYDHSIFLFNPNEINRTSTFEITSYYNKEAENILKNIDDTELLNNIIVSDDDIIGNEEISLEFSVNEKNEIETRIINSDLEGEQKDCPKGEIVKIYNSDDEIEEKEKKEEKEEEKDEENEIIELDKREKQKQILKIVCQKVLIPLLSLLSRTYKELEFCEMINNKETKEIIENIFKDKRIILNKNSYNSIINIMDNNNEIINNIREIYRTAPSNKIHELIAKHFIPSIEEKKNNAEIPTPLILVNEMLDKIPQEFWKTPKKVFEPCCGKGNFVMKIFEKMYNGLSEMIPDKRERCNIIINKCLYYGDKTKLNVFITTEILKCEIESRTGIEELHNFNSYHGDTLELDINEIFNIDNFDAVIGNPPYQDNQENKGKRGGGDLLWNKFVIKSINILTKNGYLLFVHPPGWRKPESERSKFKNLFTLMAHNNQIIYLEIHDTKDGLKIFNAGTRYDWYLLQKRKQCNRTIIKGDDRKLYKINLRKWKFLPNSNFNIIKKLLANNTDNKCYIIYGVSNYETRKKWVSCKKDKEYKYTLIHSTPQNGIRYMYSLKNDNGHFGIAKVIFGDSGIYNSVIDINGDYGMTQHSIGIKINNIEEGNKIKKYIESIEFKNILNSCSWSNFQIDWRLFTYFKQDFYNTNLEKINLDIIEKEKQVEIMKQIITKISKRLIYL
jgi:hypothetical protein